MVRTLAFVFVIAWAASTAVADFSSPWLPDWSGDTGYTSQWWGLHAVGGEEPAQPLAADNYIINSFGTPTAVWDTQTPEHFYGWLADPAGDHPGWVDEVWGGMVQMTGGIPITLTMTIPTGADVGALKVFVQYDWYNFGGMSAGISGATEVTPAGYYDYVIGMSASEHEWFRTTQVFEFDSNPGSVEVVLTATGFAPIVDSFSVTTAVGASVPIDMPVPEPASLGLVALGGLLALRRRRG